MNPLLRKRFIHCALMIPFILHWPLLFFSKVSNSRKKVLITPGLYFPNYCVTYLPRDISRDFNKCEHVNLRREWKRAVFGVVLHSKQSEDSWQKEGGLSRRSREEPCWQCSTKPWRLHERPGEKLCKKPRKFMKNQEKSCVDSAEQSRESYKNDLEKSRNDSAARSCEHRHSNRGA